MTQQEVLVDYLTYNKQASIKQIVSDTGICSNSVRAILNVGVKNNVFERVSVANYKLKEVK